MRRLQLHFPLASFFSSLFSLRNPELCPSFPSGTLNYAPLLQPYLRNLDFHLTALTLSQALPPFPPSRNPLPTLQEWRQSFEAGRNFRLPGDPLDHCKRSSSQPEAGAIEAKLHCTCITFLPLTIQTEGNSQLHPLPKPFFLLPSSIFNGFIVFHIFYSLYH